MYRVPEELCQVVRFGCGAADVGAACAECKRVDPPDSCLLPQGVTPRVSCLRPGNRLPCLDYLSSTPCFLTGHPCVSSLESSVHWDSLCGMSVCLSVMSSYLHQ